MKSYKFDPSCTNPENIVLRERYTIEPPQTSNFYFVIPKSAPFFAGRDFTITHYPSGRVLQPGTDYVPSNRFVAATRSTGLGVYGSITILNHTLVGILEITYHTIGGIWTFDEASILEYLTRVERDPRITSWDSVLDQPTTFPPTLHDFNINDLKGWEVLMPELVGIKEAIDAKGSGALDDHKGDFNNPHVVTKDQVGLGNVQNYSIATVAEANNGIVNTAYMTPLRTRNLVEVFAVTPLVAHTDNRLNPHGVTKAQVGLSDVQNYGIALASDIISLDSNGLYMTPLRTGEALSRFRASDITPHLLDQNNPHGTTKAQVGLGNVQNYGMATAEIAIQGTSQTHYMSPAMSDMLLQARAVDPMMEHIRDLTNPHGTTKTQVGLGLVPNYGPATDVDAVAMTSRETLMTPYLTRLALQEFMGTGEGGATLASHLADRANPHRTTADQVGAYTKAEVLALLLNKLDVTATAVNSDKLAGLTLLELVTYVQDNLDLDILALLTPGQVTELGNVILLGKAATAGDSDTVQGLNVSEIVAMANGSVGVLASIMEVPTLELTTTSSHHFKIGEVSTGGSVSEIGLLITGGVSVDGSHNSTPPLTFLRVDVTDKVASQSTISLQSLTGNITEADFYLTSLEDVDGSDEGFEIWCRIDPSLASMSITNLTPSWLLLDTYTAPASIVDMVVAPPVTGFGYDGNEVIYTHTKAEYVYSPLQTKHFTPAGDMVASKVPVLNQPTTANAGSATKLQTARTVTISGAASGSATFDGTANINIALTLLGKAPTAGAADTAIKLFTGRTISLSGDGTWTSSLFDGSANSTGIFTLTNSGVTAGKFTKVTVDAKGRVTLGEQLVSGDIPTLDAAKIVSGIFDAARIPLLNQTTTANAGSATKLQTARTIGGVSFDGSANINLPGVNQAGNQATSGAAGSLSGGGRSITPIATGGGGYKLSNGTETLDIYSTPWTPPARDPAYEDMDITSVMAFDVTTEGYLFNKVIFSTNLVATSDRRLKSNIAVIDKPMDRIRLLNGVTYDFDGRADAGLIADEVEQALDVAVRYIPHDELSDAQGVKYNSVIGLLVEGIKYQDKEIVDLRGRLELLEQQMTTLIDTLSKS